MRRILRTLLLAGCFFVGLSASISAWAEARVFTLSNPHPEDVLNVLQKTYGDKIHANLIQGQLVVVGATKQLDEIGALLVKIDRAPTPLRLTLREQLPAIKETPDTVIFSSGDDGYMIDTAEGAIVSIEYSQIVQQPSSNGWWVQIENVSTPISTLTLQVRLEGGRNASVIIGFSKEENGQRRVFGSTAIGELGTWIPLLPQPLSPSDGAISSGPKAGSQLYLRVEKNSRTLQK